MVDAPSAEAVVAGRQRLAALNAAVADLPDKTRTVFSLHKFEGLSYAEVAARLEISRSSVEKHMMDALRMLAAKVKS
jgi:RNA polymerase sigma-70 factor (ECF subfamily)